MSHPAASARSPHHSSGSVTVEDAPASDDDDFALDEDDFQRVSGSGSAGAAASAARNGSAAHATKSGTAGSGDGDRSGLSPGEEGTFDVWLRTNVNGPLLAVLPVWVSPNSLSYANVAACWGAFALSYVAWTYEHVYPALALSLRILMALLMFSSMVLDCLDGMQARKTGRTSKLGEVLDHSLDAANIPLCSCAVLMTLMPDQYTILLSLIGGVCVYNAQLVIYRHSHVFVLPPVTGPVAQMMACIALVSFALFFRLFDRHAYLPTIIVTVFALGGNIAQAQNNWFFGKHLLAHSCLIPHIRFACVMVLHGLLLPLGYLTVPEYLLSACVLAYRLNGRYVLDTLVSFRPFTSSHSRESVKKEDTAWRIECVAWLAVLYALAFAFGAGGEESKIHGSATGLPLVTDSLFHLVLYAGMGAMVALNIQDLQKALPALQAK